MDDTELTERLARDLDGSFEHLVEAHVDRCYSIALRVLGNPHDAEEVAQDALVRAYRALGGYDPQRIRELRLRAWLATIVVNLCRNRVRRHPVPTTPLEPLVEAGREPAASDADRPGARRRRRPPTASASPRSSPPSPTDTASPWCCAMSTTCPTPSSPRSSADPRAPSRPRSPAASRCSAPPLSANELEELTA